MIHNHYNCSLLRLGMKPGHVRGMVLGSHVFYSGNYYEVYTCPNLRLHEECHVRQYQRYGVAGFLARYVWAFIIGVVKRGNFADAYWYNWLEVEARLAEDAHRLLPADMLDMLNKTYARIAKEVKL